MSDSRNIESTASMPPVGMPEEQLPATRPHAVDAHAAHKLSMLSLSSLKRVAAGTVLSAVVLVPTTGCGAISSLTGHSSAAENAAGGSGGVSLKPGENHKSDPSATHRPALRVSDKNLVTLKPGSHRKTCETLQSYLDHNERHDYFRPPTDGYVPSCGPVTTNGLKQWQKDSGYVPDGKIEVLGPLWKRLKSEATLSDQQVGAREAKVEAAVKAKQEAIEARKEAAEARKEARQEAIQAQERAKEQAAEEARKKADEEAQRAADEATERKAEALAPTLPAGISRQAIEHAIEDGEAVDSNKTLHLARILQYDEATGTISVPLSVGAQFGDERPADAKNPNGFVTPQGEWPFLYKDPAGIKAISHEIKIPGTNRWAHMAWAHYFLPGIATHLGSMVPSHGCEHILTMEGAEMMYKLPEGTYNVVHRNEPQWHVTTGAAIAQPSPESTESLNQFPSAEGTASNDSTAEQPVPTASPAPSSTQQ